MRQPMEMSGKWKIVCREKSMTFPWLDDFSELEKTFLVKKNAVRTVFRIPASGDCPPLYVKHAKNSFLKRFFHHDVLKQEYDASEKLEKACVPSVRNVAYGTCSDGTSILVSEEAPDAVDALSFWFKEAVNDAEVKKKFLLDMGRLVASMIRSGVRHRDFHLGNVLYDAAGGKMLLVDLAGITVNGRPLTGADAQSLMRIFADVDVFLSDDDRKNLFSAALDVTDEHVISEIRDTMLASLRKLVVHTWKKRKKQLLSGSSKFCRTVYSEAGNRIIVRNSPCYSAVPFDPIGRENIKMSVQDGEKVFLRAFFNELSQIKTDEKKPVAMEYDGNGNAILYF